MPAPLTAGGAARALRVTAVRERYTGTDGTGTRRPPRGGWRSTVRWLRLLVLLGLSTPSMATIPVGPAGASPLQQAPRGTPLAYGFQGDFFQTEARPRAVAALRESGFGWAKQQVRWDEYEIQEPDCAAQANNCLEETLGGRLKYFRRDRVGFLDAVVGDLSGAGLRVLLSVVRAPAFYAAPGGHAPSDADHLRDFVFFLGRRYSDKVQAIEPWNEQN